MEQEDWVSFERLTEESCWIALFIVKKFKIKLLNKDSQSYQWIKEEMWHL